uniref:Exonuclease domain-containing protein n=1 Tax=Heterorhabditis bacteriophora TaxID=37862 RepID=A0A1I7XT10_HETBA
MLRSGLLSIRKMCGSLSDKASRLIWIDCEMTGLDHNKQTLVEIAVIVTDKDLNVKNSYIDAEGPDIVIHQPESVLEKMESWPYRMFKENGLMERIRTSEVSMVDAENQV